MRAFLESASSSIVSVRVAGAFVNRFSGGRIGSPSSASTGCASCVARFPGGAGFARGMTKRTRRPGMLSGSSASFAAIGGTRPSLGSRLVGNGVTRGSLRVSAMGLRLTTVWNEAAFGPASSTRRAARQSFHIRPPNAAAASVPYPEARASRAAPRPAPPPMTRQSPGDRPMIESNSRATSAAAVIATGSASGARPTLVISRSKAQPTAPPAPAGGPPGICNTEQASAPRISAAPSIARRRAKRCTGRRSIRRNAQPSSTAGTR